jgi:hypothetical protein
LEDAIGIRDATESIPGLRAQWQIQDPGAGQAKAIQMRVERTMQQHLACAYAITSEAATFLIASGHNQRCVSVRVAVAWNAGPALPSFQARTRRLSRIKVTAVRHQSFAASVVCEQNTRDDLSDMQYSPRQDPECAGRLISTLLSLTAARGFHDFPRVINTASLPVYELFGHEVGQQSQVSQSASAVFPSTSR